MQKVLANLLLDHPPLKDLISTNLHWDTMVQGAPLPNIVMFVVSGVADYTMAGPSGYVKTRVQFDSRGLTSAQARSVANALRERLSGFRGQYSGFQFLGCFEESQRTRFDKDGNVTWFTDSRDYFLHWAPA
ncbi:tail completion protein gp17 [Devosia aurantiaca]|uniref:DUF3168 domain-containing protein n=1 Tax=Devosia aurantiaca TaxID=2714858 RepID=A0A6M1SHK9_9HYPH|nr:DUF3168 domain-containing protein [Devosia aurantiaca]NGP19299.1 hypothetical protein [Devosia aurantiaca]